MFQKMINSGDLFAVVRRKFVVNYDSFVKRRR